MSARNTGRLYNPDRLVFEFWLVFGSDGTMRLTRNAGKVERGERAMYLKAVLPLALWKTPELSGLISVDAPTGEPMTINLDIAAEALKGTLGVDVDLKIKDPSE